MQGITSYFIISVQKEDGSGRKYIGKPDDTVQKLQNWIAEHQGIPVDHQRLYVVFSSLFCRPKKREIVANPEALLAVHIPKNAAYLFVSTRLRGIF